MRVDTGSDCDYNDVIFQVRGATGTAVHLDDVIDHNHDWRGTDLAHQLIAYATSFEQNQVSGDHHLPIDNHQGDTTPAIDNHQGDITPVDLDHPIDPVTGIEYKPNELLVKFNADAIGSIPTLAHTYGASSAVVAKTVTSPPTREISPYIGFS